MIIADALRKSSLYLATFLCSSLIAQAAVLEVTCVDQNGKPISGVKVQSIALGQQKGDQEKSNKQGVAVFKKLSDGYYRVFAHQKGYDPVYLEFIQLQGDGQKSVSLTFEPGDAKELIYFEDKDKLAAAAQALRDGATAMQSGQFDEAETQLKKAIDDNPAEPASYFSLGMLYVQQKKWDEAETQLKKAVELFRMYAAAAGPSNPTVQQQLEQAENEVKFLPMRRLASQIETATKQKDYKKALSYLDELQKLRPNDPRIYYTMAYMLAQTQQLDAAIEKIDKAIELKPDEKDFTDLKTQLVGIQKQREAQKEANALKAKVLEVQQLNKDGKYQEAIDKAKAAMSQVPEDLQAALWAEITNAHIRLEQYPEAVAAYQHDLELNKQPVAPGLYKLGEQFVKKGQQDAASAAFEKVLELDPNYAEAYYQLGMYYFYEKQDKVKAKAMLEKYLTMGKNEDNINNAKNVLVVMEKEKG